MKISQIHEADSVDLKDLEGYDQQTASVAADIKAKYPNAPDALSAVLGFIADIRDASKKDDEEHDQELAAKKKRVDGLEQRVYDLEQEDTSNRKKTMENQINEGVLDDADEDGWMAKSQLYKLAKYAISLHSMISDTDNLEPWVQAKITRAAEDMSSVKHYLEYEAVNPHGEQPNDETMPSIAATVPSGDVEEGYEVMPSIDRDKYQERPGLEGPFQTRSGKVVYYDPKEGSYYDPTSDMYISYDDWRKLDSKTMHSTDVKMEAKERPYICFHAKKGKHECHADSSYGAAKKAAAHWKLKSTAGITPKLADVEHVAEGKSPHKKGTAKYKKHMAAMHAEDFDPEHFDGEFDGYATGDDGEEDGATIEYTATIVNGKPVVHPKSIRVYAHGNNPSSKLGNDVDMDTDMQDPEDMMQQCQDHANELWAKQQQAQGEGNAYAHKVRQAKMNGKKKGDKIAHPDSDEDDITLEKQKTPIGEFILSYFDRENGTFPKGETAVLTMVEKDYGDQYVEPAAKFMQQAESMCKNRRRKKAMDSRYPETDRIKALAGM